MGFLRAVLGEAAPLGTAQIRRGQASFSWHAQRAPRFSPYRPSLPHVIATPTRRTYHFLVTSPEITHLYLNPRESLFKTKCFTAELLSAADLDLVIQLNNSCSDFFLFQNGLPPSENDAREVFEYAPPQFNGATKLPIGIFCSEHLAGVMDVLRGYRTASEWYIGFMLLAPSFRGQGMGTEIHNEFVGYARSTGANRLLIAVLEANESARRFWLRLGYRRVKDYPPVQFGKRLHALTEFELVL